MLVKIEKGIIKCDAKLGKASYEQVKDLKDGTYNITFLYGEMKAEKKAEKKNEKKEVKTNASKSK